MAARGVGGVWATKRLVKRGGRGGLSGWRLVEGRGEGRFDGSWVLGAFAGFWGWLMAR